MTDRELKPHVENALDWEPSVDAAVANDLTVRLVTSFERNDTDIAQAAVSFDPLIINCPFCGSDDSALRHDVRSSLIYFCENCEHEWQIDPADEPTQAASPSSRSARTVAACHTPSHDS